MTVGTQNILFLLLFILKKRIDFVQNHLLAGKHFFYAQYILDIDACPALGRRNNHHPRAGSGYGARCWKKVVAQLKRKAQVVAFAFSFSYGFGGCYFPTLIVD